MILDEFNDLPEADAIAALLETCACLRWAETLVRQRPFASIDALLEAAHAAWKIADEEELLVAFGAHPRLGDVAQLRERFDSVAHREQGRVLEASESILAQLKARNDAYFERFGFIFIVCATGLGAAQMLERLEARIDNSRADELANAADEQGRIMELRLRRMLEEDPNA